jgi:hypothetical protein
MLPPPAVAATVLLLLPVSDAMTLGFTRVQSLPIPVVISKEKENSGIYFFDDDDWLPWQQLINSLMAGDSTFNALSRR